jgi:nucleotide-binding universal stress UspA family protein
MYKRILVPLDGSETGEAILPFATKIAGPLDAELILLHVIAETNSELVLVARAQAEKYLDTLTASLADEGIRVRPELRDGSGSAADAILAAAGALDAGLIAMATRGRTGLNRLLFGSVAEAVLREAPVPVLLVRTAVQAAPPAGRP